MIAPHDLFMDRLPGNSDYMDGYEKGWSDGIAAVHDVRLWYLFAGFLAGIGFSITAMAIVALL